MTGKLHSLEHDQKFEVKDTKLQLLKERDTPTIFLSVNGKNILDWFKQKYQKIKQTAQLHIKPIQKPKGIKR